MIQTLSAILTLWAVLVFLAVKFTTKPFTLMLMLIGIFNWANS